MGDPGASLTPQYIPQSPAPTARNGDCACAGREMRMREAGTARASLWRQTRGTGRASPAPCVCTRPLGRAQLPPFAHGPSAEPRPLRLHTAPRPGPLRASAGKGALRVGVPGSVVSSHVLLKFYLDYFSTHPHRTSPSPPRFCCPPPRAALQCCVFALPSSVCLEGAGGVLWAEAAVIGGLWRIPEGGSLLRPGCMSYS